MNIRIVKTLSLLFSLLLLCSFSLAEEAADTWICLSCGCDARGDVCEVCGEYQGAWICTGCGTRNLSAACRQCGKSREESLSEQASDPRPFAAYPAVRFLAASGDPASLLRLGRYYEKGIVVEQNTDQAVSCFRSAGEAGNPDAWIYLGRLYDAGVLVSRDYAEAMDCYQKAADLGSAEACWYLGSFYEEGTGVEQNYGMAIDYYHMAAERGDADAWMSLAYCYLQGNGVEEDRSKALEYYEKAAEAGSAAACDYLGYLYMSGSMVPLENDTELMALFDAAGVNLQSGWRKETETGENHLYGIPQDKLPGLIQYAYAQDGFLCVPLTGGNQENAMKFLRILCRDMLTAPPEETAADE